MTRHCPPPHPHSHQARRDAIINRRLIEAFVMLGIGFVIGMVVMVVDKGTGKWLVAASLMFLGASFYWMVKTLVRRRAKRL